jgi:hypothetical protein
MATNHLASANEVACARMTGKPEAALVKCCNQAFTLIDLGQPREGGDERYEIHGQFTGLPASSGSDNFLFAGNPEVIRWEHT